MCTVSFGVKSKTLIMLHCGCSHRQLYTPADADFLLLWFRVVSITLLFLSVVVHMEDVIPYTNSGSYVGIHCMYCWTSNYWRCSIVTTQTVWKQILDSIKRGSHGHNWHRLTRSRQSRTCFPKTDSVRECLQQELKTSRTETAVTTSASSYFAFFRQSQASCFPVFPVFMLS